MKGNMKDILKTTLILTLICVIVAVGLALTNSLTSEKIAAQNEKAENEAMSRVLPGDMYNEKTATVSGKEYSYREVIKNGETAGYIFTVANNGYGGPVKVMTGVDIEGNVTAIEVISAPDETPGLGQKVTNTSFWEQFKGKSGEISVSRTEAGKDEVLAITGATISTKSVVASVNEALKIFDTVAIKEAE